MKILAGLIFIGSLCAPVLAAPTMTYQELLALHTGDSSPQSVIGKTVLVTNAKLGEFGYAANKADETTFLCESGNPSLVKRKLKHATFQGTTEKAQGYESLTIWSLKDCTLVTPSSSNSTAGASSNASIPSSSSNTGSAVRKTYSAGNKQWRGSINVDSDGKTAKVLISTGSAGGSCEAKGIARFASPTEAMFADIDEPTCKVTLTFTNSSSVRVISDGCENMVCGGMAPGIDHIYKLKN